MKEKKSYIMSPAGEAQFLYITRPDTTFDNNGTGKYSVSVVMDPENPEHVEFVKTIKNIALKQVGENATLPFRDHVDSYGDATGKKLVKFSSSYEPKVFDAWNNPLADDVMIGRGSTVKVAGKVNVYKNIAGRSGVNLYLNAVQVISLVEYQGGASAESYGFKTEAESPSFAGHQPSFGMAEEIPF